MSDPRLTEKDFARSVVDYARLRHWVGVGGAVPAQDKTPWWPWYRLYAKSLSCAAPLLLRAKLQRMCTIRRLS